MWEERRDPGDPRNGKPGSAHQKEKARAISDRSAGHRGNGEKGERKTGDEPGRQLCPRPVRLGGGNRFGSSGHGIGEAVDHASRIATASGLNCDHRGQSRRVDS
jgi:hypothetical protein